MALSSIVFASNKARRLARLTRRTGKSSEYVHPKHLLGDTQDNYWYLAYIASEAAVLDVGCGHGMHALKAARRCRHVVGVDGNLESPGVALRSGKTLPSPNVAFFAADLEQGLPVQGNRFDTMICLDLLEHLHQRDLLFTEIRRALKPGGTMFLSVPNRGTSWKRRLDRAGLFSYSDPDHKIEDTLLELEAELARTGFRVVHLHPTVYDTPLIGAIDLVVGLSLPLYRRLTEARRRLARRYPEENAGFFAVCEAK